ALAGDQHVGRLDVAVHHEVAVRELNGLADGDEEPQPIVHAEFSPLAVVGDGDTVDVLHHQEGAAIVRHPSVQQSGDARVGKAGEDLALGAEAALQFAAQPSALHELYGDVLSIRLVARGKVDLSHPAAADAAPQGVGTHAGLREGI